MFCMFQGCKYTSRRVTIVLMEFIYILTKMSQIKKLLIILIYQKHSKIGIKQLLSSDYTYFCSSPRLRKMALERFGT